MQTLVTGAAGFIGFHICQGLLKRGDTVIGIDNLNHYYDVHLKEARLAQINQNPNFTFFKLDIADAAALKKLFADSAIDKVVHLAAQAGVRYSLENPEVYVNSNLIGFANLLECCRSHQIRHLLFASSSSVYGANSRQPFSEHHAVDHPLSFYAATKKANETMAHSYASLYQLHCTGIRYFTVYGPWGRPDMALFKFTEAIRNNQPIDLYNSGNMIRDFTYIDDAVNATIQLLDIPAISNPAWQSDMPDPATSFAPYRIYNIGNGQPQTLQAFVEAIEIALGKKAIKKLLPMQAGDVSTTAADVKLLKQTINSHTQTPITEGVARFVQWYCDYYEKR